MPSVINRVPAGLLALLGSKVGGINPALLADQVIPTIDFSRFYLAGSLERSTVSGNIAAVGLFASTLVVPENEFWVVDQYTLSAGAALGAGQALQVAPCYLYSLAGSTRALQVGQPSLLAGVGDLPTAGSGGFIVPPGSTLGLVCFRITAGPVNAFLFNASFTRLQV